MTCKDCKFYKALESQCRKKLVTGLVGTNQGIQVVAGFPKVNASDWCGEHQPRLELQS